MALPLLAFATPTPSPDLVLLRRERAAYEPPLLLKRKRKSPSPSSCTSAIDAEACYFTTLASLPYLDYQDFGNINTEGTYGDSTLPTPLPNIKLYPRTKKTRIGCFLSSSPQEQEQVEPETRTRLLQVDTSTPSEDNNDVSKVIDEVFSTSLARTSSSKNVISRSSSMNLTRSLSLQFNLSLSSLTNCPLSASTTSMLPHRKSLLHIPSSFSSSQDIQSQDVNSNSSNRRSPVTTTLDYFATAMRFPDVAIGLSI